jgi:ZIP family zinc transporter
VQGNVLLAFGLTLGAGLATGIGSAMALLGRRSSGRFLSAALGFSAGVMIFISFVEILAQSRTALVGRLGSGHGGWATLAAFFGGILVIGLVDRILPSYENPHEARTVEEMATPEDQRQRQLQRMGTLTALAIAIHNFPEGMATFTAALNDPRVGVSIGVAIAIHNIPEGIAVAVPIYFATGDRRKAFWLSFLSGLSEPLGALLGYLILRTVFTPTVFGVVMGATAGVMVFLALDELLPTAREYGRGHLAVYGLVAGMAVMAVSLQLLG